MATPKSPKAVSGSFFCLRFSNRSISNALELGLNWDEILTTHPKGSHWISVWNLHQARLVRRRTKARRTAAFGATSSAAEPNMFVRSPGHRGNRPLVTSSASANSLSQLTQADFSDQRRQTGRGDCREGGGHLSLPVHKWKDTRQANLAM